uniref:Uncharacterized protein n=1 Tax=Chelonoidis abingdonii TaxID=106734 RepID=A0A8C0IL43_CHEAB
ITVPLRLTGKVYLFQGKRRRLEAVQQNNQNLTKPYLQKTKTPVSLHGRIKLLYLSQILQSQHCCMNPWLVAKRGKRGKLRSHILFGQQMAECHQQEGLKEKPKELPQSSLQKTSSAETDCNDKCSRSTEAEDTHSITPGMPTVSAFFSLAALAEVAAMENVHRQRDLPLFPTQ